MFPVRCQTINHMWLSEDSTTLPRILSTKAGLSNKGSKPESEIENTFLFPIPQIRDMQQNSKLDGFMYDTFTQIYTWDILAYD
jgi:hypothetical protein